VNKIIPVKETIIEKKITSDITADIADINGPFAWKCCLFGLGEAITVETNSPPCRFWRYMQYILLGNKWIKNKGGAK